MRKTLFILFFLAVCPLIWAADESTTPTLMDQASQMHPSPPINDPQTSLKRFLPNLGHNFVHVFSKQNIWPFVYTAVGTGIASTADTEVHEYFAAHDPGQPFETIMGEIGKPYVLAPAIGALLIGGQHSESQHFREFTYALAQAYTLDYVIVGSIKYAVGRERPNKSNMQSFPSGHSADGFMIASVLHHYYGTRGGIYGYTFASLMSFSRLKIDKHWLSDVVAGSALGYIIGTSVCNNMSIQKNKLQLTMIPLVEPVRHRFGLNMYMRF